MRIDVSIRRISGLLLQLAHRLNRKAAEASRCDHHQREEAQSADCNLGRTVVDQHLEEIGNGQTKAGTNGHCNQHTHATEGLVLIHLGVQLSHQLGCGVGVGPSSGGLASASPSNVFITT